MARFYYGGQAVIEGVMMRGRRMVAVAVRAPSGQVVVYQESLPRHVGARLLAWPFVRGLVALYDMLFLGTRMLVFSAEIAAADPSTDFSDGAPPPSGGMGIGTVFGMVVAVSIFLMAPVLLTRPVDRLGVNALTSNVVEGVIRLVMFLAYLLLISRLPEIQRVFAYHGAEHKTINAFESGATMTVEGVRPCSVQHPRCGTGFLLVVAVLCIVVFAFLGRPPLPIRLATRLLLIPVVTAIAYELLRLGANNYHRAWVRVLLRPSLALQRLTTREPDDSQIEVAVRAFTVVRTADLDAVAVPAPDLLAAAEPA